MLNSVKRKFLNYIRIVLVILRFVRLVVLYPAWRVIDELEVMIEWQEMWIERDRDNQNYRQDLMHKKQQQENYKLHADKRCDCEYK